MSGFFAGYFLAMALHYGGWWWFFCGVSLTWFILLAIGKQLKRQRIREEARLYAQEYINNHSDHRTSDSMRESDRID